VAYSWSFVDKISAVWENTKADYFPNYESGTMGPKEVDELLEKDGYFWWPVTDLEVDICK
ncbi:MAG: glucose-6-phosphate dehydrogenase, partial [Bacillus sp. (in: firmicutes)]